MASSLPPEIIRLILQQLGHVCTTLEDYYGHGHSQYEKPAAEAATYAKTRTLLSACLVNRAWSKEAQVLLYSNINCARGYMLYGWEAMHSQEFARARTNHDGSDEGLYDESLDGDSDEFAAYFPEGLVPEGEHDGAEVISHTQSQGGQEQELASHNDGQDQGEEDLEEEESENEASWEQEPPEPEEEPAYNDLDAAYNHLIASYRPRNAGSRFSKDSCSADITIRLQALEQTLSTSPRLASYVKTLSIDPGSQKETSILGYSTNVEEVCFVHGSAPSLSLELVGTIYKLQNLKICQLHELPARPAYQIWTALAFIESLEAIRLSSIRWEASDIIMPDFMEPLPYMRNVSSVLIDSATLSTDAFKTLLRHLNEVTDPGKLDIRLHGVAWAEVSDIYSPLIGLSTTTAGAITAYKLRESALEVSDFRGLERLTTLHTLGIFDSNCGSDLGVEAAGAISFPQSITTIELGGNEFDSFEEDPPAVLSLVETWLRGEKLPNLTIFSARPGDFAILDFETMWYDESYGEIAMELDSIRRRVQELQGTLDAHEIDCNVKPLADLQRFLEHVKPIWNETEVWEGPLKERIQAVENAGVPYAPWRG